MIIARQTRRMVRCPCCGCSASLLANQNKTAKEGNRCVHSSPGNCNSHSNNGKRYYWHCQCFTRVYSKSSILTCLYLLASCIFMLEWTANMSSKKKHETALSLKTLWTPNCNPALEIDIKLQIQSCTMRFRHFISYE